MHGIAMASISFELFAPEIRGKMEVVDAGFLPGALLSVACLNDQVEALRSQGRSVVGSGLLSLAGGEESNPAPS